MLIYNWTEDLSADYDEDKHVLTLSAKDIDLKEILGGPVVLSYRSMNVRGSSNLMMPSMQASTPVRYTQIEESGRQRLKIVIPEHPTTIGFIELRNNRAALTAYALHLQQTSGWSSAWVVFLASHSTPFDYSLGKSSLSVNHGSGRVMVTLGKGMNGQLDANISVSGGGYHKAELVMRRTLAGIIFEEPVGGTTDETASLTWKPSLRDFSCIMTFRDFLPMRADDSKFFDMLKAAGATVTHSGIHGYEVQDFVFCDGVGITYDFYLLGHRLFSSDEDHTILSIEPEAQ